MFKDDCSGGNVNVEDIQIRISNTMREEKRIETKRKAYISISSISLMRLSAKEY